jgi:hypothetical protein
LDEVGDEVIASAKFGIDVRPSFADHLAKANEGVVGDNYPNQWYEKKDKGNYGAEGDSVIWCK